MVSAVKGMARAIKAANSIAEGSHKIFGLVSNFVPPILNREIIVVDDEQARETALALTKEKDFFASLSSGANIFASFEVAKRLGRGKTVVTIMPHSEERYLRAIFVAEVKRGRRESESGRY